MDVQVTMVRVVTLRFQAESTAEAAEIARLGMTQESTCNTGNVYTDLGWRVEKAEVVKPRRKAARTHP